MQQHHAIMKWLSLTDFPAQQHDIVIRRQEGTEQWFVDSPEFKRWLQGSDKTLFCPGIPGAGKTMMAAITIDHICRTTLCDDIRVALLVLQLQGASRSERIESLCCSLEAAGAERAGHHSSGDAHLRPSLKAEKQTIFGRDTPGSAVCMFELYLQYTL